MNDPYASGMFKENPYFAKAEISGSLVVVLQGRYENRGLSLIRPISRAVKRHEIHELIASDEAGIGPGRDVNQIAYLGFAEMQTGGVIVEGDDVLCDGAYIGTIAGFDETHMPNHLNIVIRCASRRSGAELGLRLGGAITFRTHSKEEEE